MMIHSKIRKRYNLCLKDGLSEEYAQRSELEGFFQLNAFLCYFNTTIIPFRFMGTQNMYEIGCKRQGFSRGIF